MKPSLFALGWRQLLPYGCWQLRLQLLRLVCAPLMALRCWWWQVALGAGAQFFGLLVLRRHPTGQIRIGAAATFRSGKFSNPLNQAGACGLYAGAGATITLGQQCGLSATTISAQQLIVLGDRVLCGANVLICDSDHHPLAAQQRQTAAAGQSAPIRIDDDVWLGMNVVVLKGVHIGAGAVIAANAVVTSDIPPGMLAAGIPAKVIGRAGTAE